jgi:hypothetical protein
MRRCRSSRRQHTSSIGNKHLVVVRQIVGDNPLHDATYQNDVPEGFGVGILEEYLINNPQILTDASQMSINEYRKLRTDKQHEFIAAIQEQFAQCCQWMNQHKGQAVDEDWIACFVILLDDMTFLQSLDLFPDDAYNGVQWVWFNG